MFLKAAGETFEIWINNENGALHWLRCPYGDIMWTNLMCFLPFSLPIFSTAVKMGRIPKAVKEHAMEKTSTNGASHRFSRQTSGLSQASAVVILSGSYSREIEPIWTVKSSMKNSWKKKD